MLRHSAAKCSLKLLPKLTGKIPVYLFLSHVPVVAVHELDSLGILRVVTLDDPGELRHAQAVEVRNDVLLEQSVEDSRLLSASLEISFLLRSSILRDDGVARNEVGAATDVSVALSHRAQSISRLRSIVGAVAREEHGPVDCRSGGSLDESADAVRRDKMVSL